MSESAQNSVQLFTKVAMFFNDLREFPCSCALLEESLKDCEEFALTHLRENVLNNYVMVLVNWEKFDEAIAVFKQEIDKTQFKIKGKYYNVSSFKRN